MEELEKRMYFFVPYQLTGIQQGIQCGHAALEYSNRYNNDPIFKDFLDNWKTWVILNGGTTNTNVFRLGTLNVIYNSLVDNGIHCEAFYEPDLGDQMTSICFICDERVFNKEKYLDYEISGLDFEEWSNLIGGYQNVFLRSLLIGKRLA